MGRGTTGGDVKERPIIFSGPMVRALLAGRKTQPRRPITKPLILDWLNQFLPEFVASPENHLSPYGHPGDRLWVRETFREDLQHFESPNREPELYGYLYRADPDEKKDARRPWKPAIHMPRAACRLRLDVTAVRIERLQDVSEEDAKAEGVEKNCEGLTAHPDCPACKAAGKCQAEGEYLDYGEGEDGFPAPSAKESYRSLWDSLNAERAPWASNPLVWVIEFKREGKC